MFLYLTEAYGKIVIHTSNEKAKVNRGLKQKYFFMLSGSGETLKKSVSDSSIFYDLGAKCLDSKPVVDISVPDRC